MTRKREPSSFFANRCCSSLNLLPPLLLLPLDAAEESLCRGVVVIGLLMPPPAPELLEDATGPCPPDFVDGAKLVLLLRGIGDLEELGNPVKCGFDVLTLAEWT